MSRHENDENFYELSQTLIERRKRLHELASEINQWEDEALMHANQQKIQPPQTITPKQFKWSQKTTPKTDEIQSVTNKILAKRNSNVQESTGSVKSIKSKFENMTHTDSKCESSIVNENLTPKSIIQKFEQLTKEKSSSQPSIQKVKTSTSSLKNTPRPTEDLHDESSIINTDNIKPKSIIEKFESMAKGSCGKASNYSTSLTYVSSLPSNTSQDEDEFDDNDIKAKFIDEEVYEEIPIKNEETSLFDETTDDSPETYSLSASDYTGSLMNQDEFEDDDDYDEEYDSLDDDPSEIVNEVTIQKTPEKLSYSADLSAPCTSVDIGSSSANSDLQPFSIQEYRKQKQKTVRRSSIMPRKEKKQAQKSPLAEEVDDNSKKLKYLERIKELEDLIKNEDNIIHQTGIALERCINDLSATNEHIECNRILLISCQKRQAYSSEINRLKHLINVDKQDQNESNDLTGLLIFSDLQLPIKESYLNKLKSGEEKRIFYFLCLIRNGVQVLQTQVINVQELITNKDTSLIFPNRMAINNVDINFKVKIDIYTLEVLPNTNKVKHTSSNAKFFSPFKFHHQSSTNNYGGYNYPDQTNLNSQKAKTSNFIHIDTVEICQEDIFKNKFKLNISSSSIPLSGILYVNVRCMPSKSIELKGFMSVFEDSSSTGFGTWDRRWCFLNNYNISYWKYPEDEYRNGPLGVINLTKCVNDKVSILPRDLCARKYSMELMTHEDTDKRYRLSADSKDQANDWLTNINFALANLRLWNPKQNKK